MLSWPTSAAGKHDKLSHFMGHISAVLAAIGMVWSKVHTDSRLLRRSANWLRINDSSSLAYFRDQNPKPGNDKVSASGFSSKGEKKSSRNLGVFGLFIVSNVGDSWKRDRKKLCFWKHFFWPFFKHCDMDYATLLIFEENWGVAWEVAARISSFQRGKKLDLKIGLLFGTHILWTFVLRFFFFQLTHNVWKWTKGIRKCLTFFLKRERCEHRLILCRFYHKNSNFLFIL